MLLSKLDRDEAQITTHFLESLSFTAVNLPEIPTYFKAVLRAKINGTIAPPKKEGAEATEE